MKQAAMQKPERSDGMLPRRLSQASGCYPFQFCKHFADSYYPLTKRGDRVRFTHRLRLFQHIGRDPAREGNFLVHMTTTGGVFLAHLRDLVRWKSIGEPD